MISFTLYQLNCFDFNFHSAGSKIKNIWIFSREEWKLNFIRFLTYQMTHNLYLKGKLEYQTNYSSSIYTLNHPFFHMHLYILRHLPWACNPNVNYPFLRVYKLDCQVFWPFWLYWDTDKDDCKKKIIKTFHRSTYTIKYHEVVVYS